MALQQRMGLLSEWGRRIDSSSNHYSGIDGKAVAVIGLQQRGLLDCGFDHDADYPS
jgi:hypothetical protein